MTLENFLKLAHINDQRTEGNDKDGYTIVICVHGHGELSSLNVKQFRIEPNRMMFLSAWSDGTEQEIKE